MTFWLGVLIGGFLAFLFSGISVGLLARYANQKQQMNEASEGVELSPYPWTAVIKAAADLDLAMRRALLDGVNIQVATMIDKNNPAYPGGRPVVHVAVLDESGENVEARWPVA